MKNYKYLIDLSYICNVVFFSCLKGNSYKSNFDPMEEVADFELELEHRLDSLLNMFPVEETLLVKDCKRSTIWRKEFDDGYKASRDDYDGPKKKPSFLLINELLSDHGYNFIGVDKCECDDILAIAGTMLPNATIVSSDKDLLQIGCAQIDALGKEVTLESFFKEQTKKFKRPITANDIILAKCISGDTGDSVPNIKKGIGIAKATDMVVNPKKLYTFLGENPEVVDRLKLNRTMVDLNKIPDALKIEIREALDAL